MTPRIAPPTLIWYDIGVKNPITPAEPLPPPPPIPRGGVAVVCGRAPIWRYGQAWHALHGGAAAALAVYDPKLGVVIVASHSPDYAAGQVLAADPPDAT